MTKQSAKVLYNYIEELAREAKVPICKFQTYNLQVVVQDGKIFEIKIDGSGKIRPEK